MRGEGRRERREGERGWARRSVAGGVLLLLAWAAVLLVPALGRAATLLDALIATVGTRVITLSDARLLRGLGLLPPGDTDPFRALIDRALMVAEVERFQPPQPVPSRIAEELARVRGRLTPAEWDALLRRTGTDEARVRAIVREGLQLESYLEQRFGALAEPSDELLRQEYQSRQAALAAGASLPPFDTLAPSLRAEMRATRFTSLVDQWVAELRQRAQVSVAPVPEGAWE